MLLTVYSRKGSRHFCSKVHSSQIDFISVFMYFSIVSVPGHFCIAAPYKFSVYCIVLYCVDIDMILSEKTIFSRSYCYTVCIGSWRHNVVCPSVCLLRCALWLSGSV